MSWRILRMALNQFDIYRNSTACNRRECRCASRCVLHKSTCRWHVILRVERVNYCLSSISRSHDWLRERRRVFCLSSRANTLVSTQTFNLRLCELSWVNMLYPTIWIFMPERKFISTTHTNFLMSVVRSLGRLVETTCYRRLLWTLVCFVQVITTIYWVMHGDCLDLLIVYCTIYSIILILVSHDTCDGNLSTGYPRFTALITLLAIVLWLNWFVNGMMKVLVSLFS